MDDNIALSLLTIEDKIKTIKKNNDDLNKYRIDLIAFKQQTLKEIEKSREELTKEKDKIGVMQKAVDLERNKLKLENTKSISSTSNFGGRKKSTQ